MYELLILGILRTRNMTGYKLGQVLESSLVPRREISNGVMYPLLSRLENHGYIEFIEKQDNLRKKKMAQITQAGIERFQELMMMPIPMDAKRESVFRFKFRGMDGVDSEAQWQILLDYENANQTDLNIYQSVQQHLKTKLQEPASDHNSLTWGIRSLELSLQICQTKQAWIDKCRAQMKQKKEVNDD